MQSDTKYTIITNNPKVWDNFNQEYAIVKAKDIYEVMSKTRDHIHNGYQLETHPLSGSIKPVQTPYKSIVLRKSKEKLHLKSLSMWEKSNEKVEMFKKNHIPRDYPKEILEDYQEIDFSLISSAHESLREQ